jgi:pimeloyl-ACP methyl ester carboxylesterase
MARTIPNARLVEIAGAGHMPMVEQPAATNAALREFLSSISLD